ncbi:MAG: aspartate carbamoyltransferase catalytic subunit [Deltaproteobacteria bacterium]|nr:aspartate carbamoyltransferase catalytic subunit [Deltaproteobacteria bacterium]MBI3294905.1 aspartate carbamoyltransferase catalytic subunit [Deltaproteobacteria bacterium]
MLPSSLNPLGLKSVLGTEFLKKDQIQTILDRAQSLKSRMERSEPVEQTLKDKTVILLFFEPSTRTRASFELAAKRLGGTTLNLSKQMSSAEKGETLVDTARTIEAMAPDLLVLRHPSAGSAHVLDQKLKIPVVNAGDGFHEHPTQALLDLMTLLEFKKRLEGLRVLIVGDIAHSRVARSDIYALKTMGARVSVCGPPTLLPPFAERMGVEVFHHLERAVSDQDVIIALRIQFERLGAGQIPSRGEYSKYYGINSTLLGRCREDVLVMHPGPVNRGLELSPEVADGSQSVILNQVSNGVILRMAILELLVGDKIR